MMGAPGGQWRRWVDVCSHRQPQLTGHRPPRRLGRGIGVGEAGEDGFGVLRPALLQLREGLGLCGLNNGVQLIQRQGLGGVIQPSQPRGQRALRVLSAAVGGGEVGEVGAIDDPGEGVVLAKAAAGAFDYAEILRRIKNDAD